MGRKIIVVGDPTDHGGHVISGSPTQKINGKAIARLGDQVDCPQKGHGVNAIVEGDASMLINGIPVALDGHKTACGCRLIGTVRASHGGASAAAALDPHAMLQQLGPVSSTAATATESARYQFTSHMDNGTSDGRQRDRRIYAAVDGSIEVHGWENASNKKQGYGYRIKLRSTSDRSLFVYAHIDPASVTSAVGGVVIAGALLGEYADPTNGGSTGPHLHFEQWSSSGDRLDPRAFLSVVMPSHVERDFIRFRGTHPVTGAPKMHNGYDLIGPWRT